MRYLAAVVVVFILGPSLVNSQWQKFQEPQSWALKDRQGTDIAEPQVQPRSQQQRTGDVSPLLDTEPRPGASQTYGNQHDESSPKKGETDHLQSWLVALTVVQAVIIFFQTVYTRKAANAAKHSAEVAGRALEVVERPFLSVEEWWFDPPGVFRHPTGLVCRLRNAGRTPATLTKGALYVTKSDTLPARPDFLRLSPTQEGLFTVQAHGGLEYTFHLTVDHRDTMFEHVAGKPYLYGYLSYTDEFAGCHHIMFYITLDPGKPVPVNEGGYNYHVTEQKQRKKRFWGSFRNPK
jgi:hypothetical protein